MMMMMMTAVCLQLSEGEVVEKSDIVVGLDEMVREVILEPPLVQLQLNPCCDMHETFCVVCKPHP